MAKKNKGRIVRVKEQNEGAILGLDCSTAVVGWGLVSLNYELLAYGHFKPLDSKFPLIERLYDMHCSVAAICKEFNPQSVSIEDIFIYMKGNSQANTITKLASFNRVAAVSAFIHAQAQDVHFLSVHEIRKLIKVHYGLKEKIGKEDLPRIVQSKLSSSFEEIVNRKGNMAKETMDEADGIAAALAYVIQINKGNL